MKHWIMIRTTLIALFAIISTTIFAQADTIPEKLTLQQCIQIALQNNNDVQRSEVTSGISKASWQNAKGYMLPTLNGDISHGINSGRSVDPYTNTYSNQTIRFASYSLTSSLTLFNFGAIQRGIKQSKLAFQASEYEIQQQKDAVALDVILQYLQILTNKELLTAAVQQQEVALKQVERLDILNQDGSIGPEELSDLKGTYAQNQLTVASADNNLQTAKITLAQLLNIMYDKNRDVEPVNITDFAGNAVSNTDSIYQAALQNLAVVKAAELRKSSAEYSVKSYRAQRYPSLYFSGDLSTTYSSAATTQELISSSYAETDNYVLNNGSKLPVYAVQDNYLSHKIPYATQFANNFYNSLSIGISIPLLNNLGNKTQIKTALLQQKDAEIVLKTTKTQLQQNIEQAYANVVSAKNRFTALTEQVNAYKESFRIAEIKFNAGAITSVDYVLAKNYLDQASLNLIIAKYNYVLSAMVVDYYSGKLRFN
ncbi:TolC family protein [Parafilimonas sp.]|uniref:TolC family protein n=1 Tax=Parafilimonas sp. TaxID=1969739 RepID=UPI0039E2D230